MKAALLLCLALLPFAFAADLNLFESTGVDGAVFMNGDSTFLGEGLAVIAVGPNATYSGFAGHLLQVTIVHSLPDAAALDIFTGNNMATLISKGAAVVSSGTQYTAPLVNEKYFFSGVFFWNTTAGAASGSPISFANGAYSIASGTTVTIRATTGRASATITGTLAFGLTGKKYAAAVLAGLPETGCSGPGMAFAYPVDTSATSAYKLWLTGGPFRLRMTSNKATVRWVGSTPVNNLGSANAAAYDISNTNWGTAARTISVLSGDFPTVEKPELRGTLAQETVAKGGIPIVAPTCTPTAAVTTYIRTGSCNATLLANVTAAITSSTGVAPSGVFCGPPAATRRARRSALQAQATDYRIVFPTASGVRALQTSIAGTATLDAIVAALKAAGVSVDKATLQVAGVSGGSTPTVFLASTGLGGSGSGTGGTGTGTGTSAAAGVAPAFATLLALAFAALALLHS